MKIYREIGSLYIVNREDAEGYAKPVYSIEVEEAVPIEDYRSMEQTVDKLIKALAEAEPIKHGKWEYDVETAGFKCTECGKRIWGMSFEIAGINYCPNCGARMSEVME